MRDANLRMFTIPVERKPCGYVLYLHFNQETGLRSFSRNSLGAGRSDTILLFLCQPPPYYASRAVINLYSKGISPKVLL